MYGQPDDQVMYQINILFNKHDRDRSGFLNARELQHFFNDLFQCLGYPYHITKDQAKQAIYECDPNCDGRVTQN